MIAIVNYGLGNLGSIQNMLKKVGYPNAIITDNSHEIQKAEKIILPGVGAFDLGMSKLNEAGLIPVLNEEVLGKRKPILGICLGMQLLTKGSEEGQLPGLGWIDARTIRFRFDEQSARLKIPHMGWNEVTESKQHYLIQGLPAPSKFYFVHSYYVKCVNDQDELLKCHYGIDFTAAVQMGNVMGTQFHPEKSHKYGMELLKSFVNN